MFSSFFKVAIRNLYREKMYALINISGLSIAIACCVILGLYLKSELTYDRHNTKHKQIFRVVNEINTNGKVETYAVTSHVLGPMLKEEYPEIKEYVRIFGGKQSRLFWHGDKAFYWDKTYLVDDNIFDVFSHDIIYGDPKTALVDPTSIAVSESFAKKYFGNANPIGETISNEGGTNKITLVFADLPENSHLKYDALFSINSPMFNVPDDASRRRQILWKVQQSISYTYLLMPEGYDAMDFNDIAGTFYERNMAEIGRSMNKTWRCWLQPLSDIHLKSDVGHDLPTVNRFYLYGFTAVSIFILLVACINYMNLATARAAKRRQEVGMRKILGAGRLNLMFQFLGESIFFSLIALLFGLVLVELALNLTPMNDLLNKTLTLNLSHEPSLGLWLLVFALVIGLLSGIYPAFFLSSALPLSALLNRDRPGKGNIRLRELLILVQFIITVSVIACTVLMVLQMRYISHKSLGFHKENRVILTLRGTDVIVDKMPTIKKELLKNSNILRISTSSVMMGEPAELSSVMLDNKDGVLEETLLESIEVGNDFIEVMGMELIAGKDFSRRLLTDVGASVIVNETLVKKMGWEEPLGKHIQKVFDDGKVVGVVKDFHFASLHSPVGPLALYRDDIDPRNIPEAFRKDLRRFLVVNISGKDIPETLAFLQDKFSEFDPIHPLKYEFLDDAMDRLYLSENHLMKLIGIFAGVCILISCMGLFGLAAFTTEQRTKEIGIRKVLGAATWQIIMMLARNILLLVIIGAAIATLAAYYAIDEWLAGFAYHTDINPLVFILSAAVAAAVAFITIALQSYKTAQANPVKALRYE